MGLRFKKCADCGHRKMIGRSKRRCKACRRADPHKVLPPRPKKPEKPKKKSRVTVGPFKEWRPGCLPKCAYPLNEEYSRTGLDWKQRDYVLKAHGYRNYHAYLTSDLWASIRAKILLDGAECACGCNRPADQVHHKIYTEANLLGTTLDGLVPLFHECHHEIEFSGKRKVTLAEANFELKRRQLQGLPEIEAPTDDEVKSFLSGKHAHLSERRKEIVSRYLYG